MTWSVLIVIFLFIFLFCGVKIIFFMFGLLERCDDFVERSLCMNGNRNKRRVGSFNTVKYVNFINITRYSVMLFVLIQTNSFISGNRINSVFLIIFCYYIISVSIVLCSRNHKSFHFHAISKKKKIQTHVSAEYPYGITRPNFFFLISSSFLVF